MRREIRLPAAPASAGTARSIVHDAATDAGLDGNRAWDLMLATSEAIANAVLHGKAWPDQSIQLMTEPCPRGLRVEVSDCGTFERPIAPAPVDAESGRGMPIIAAVVDHLEMERTNGRTLVRFERHIASSP